MTPKRDHERTRELLASLSEAEVPAALHLLTCEDCYAEALRWLAERADLAGDPAEEKAGAEDLFRLEWKAPGLVEAFARQRAEDEGLLRELLGLSPGERSRTVTKDSRFQSERLAELTLSESERLAATDPGRAEELARLTFTLAVQLAARIPPARADSLRARACSRAADALRLPAGFCGGSPADGPEDWNDELSGAMKAPDLTTQGGHHADDRHTAVCQSVEAAAPADLPEAEAPRLRWRSFRRFLHTSKACRSSRPFSSEVGRCATKAPKKW